ncbi:MAG: hypothetical protein EHM45_22200 [Desulfobacteraceae bacterium]|nr:MAG: hypothetical protein EHM45_22200 [Desulfobacteraceae bacterium]
MQKKIFQTIVKTTLASLVLAIFLFQIGIVPARADGLTGMKDTLTRLKISELADHEIKWTLPGGKFAAGDKAMVYFGGATFVADSGWTTADFTFDDGTLRTVVAVGVDVDPVCTGGVDDVAIRVDTTKSQFDIWACPGYTASAGGASVTFTIDGTGPNGTLTNPAVAATYQVYLVGDDKGNGFNFDDDNGFIAIAIVDDDQVVVTANIDPTLTFDLDTYATATAFPTYTETPAPYSVDLGSLSISGITSSNGGGGIRSIWVDLSTNAASGAVVTFLATGGPGTDPGLYSAATSKTITSASGPLMSGWEGYGICVANVTASSGTLTWGGAYGGAGDFDGCDYASDHTVGIAQDDFERIVLHSSYSPINNGRAEILAKASAAATTPAAADYTDTLTFIATSTF